MFDSVRGFELLWETLDDDHTVSELQRRGVHEFDHIGDKTRPGIEVQGGGD